MGLGRSRAAYRATGTVQQARAHGEPGQLHDASSRRCRDVVDHSYLCAGCVSATVLLAFADLWSAGIATLQCKARCCTNSPNICTLLMADHASCVVADLTAQPSTSREMLFSNPGAELPDVYLSESVVFVEESTAGTANEQTYTVVLTHPPGMREDETVCSLW